MKLTWLGHSAFRLESDGIVALIDPFLTGNSTFEASGQTVENITSGCTHILLTHGHDDHVGDTTAIAKATGATVVGVVELVNWLQTQGVEKVELANIGGTVALNEHVRVSFVPAWHSSSTMVEGTPVYLGTPAGLMIQTPSQTIYHMGDTSLFGDMMLLQEMYKPTIGLVPIGDRFTMGASAASLACQSFFQFKTVIPMHYGTFPIIDQTPDAFKELMHGQNVRIPYVGQALEF